ncbi:Sm snRNP core protein Smb1 [Sugiyamaella lignohabitans]|uniref:Sm protein B n=1 Tax=Sugiyamaella lignohabitans TaxID=796027 RepID=A0A161HHX5_9ASCO|nr:Sm snRNP core protein Smb1 [Sugiyamaella lignohabitans]ANB15740.1 Sm snRNP core protein Smb1 [Sugiyamaella lignohabitans]
MNLVLSDTEEFRTTKKSKIEERRTLGLIILRGETVISVSIESSPTNSDTAGRLGVIKPGPGSARGITRGSAPPSGPSLVGPVRTSAPAGLPAGFGPPPGFQPPPGFGGR